MPGQGHYDFCSCGWCHGRPHYNVPTWPDASNIPRVNCVSYSIDSYSRYTDCPVCHQEVFYYHSPDDGRVFFEHPGPPWPRHPCTSDGTLTPPRVRIKRFDGRSPIDYLQQDGWLPVTITSAFFYSKIRLDSEVPYTRVHVRTPDYDVQVWFVETEDLDFLSKPLYFRPSRSGIIELASFVVRKGIVSTRWLEARMLPPKRQPRRVKRRE